jgi:DNA (cytosine-5)-methyltransferase 1
MREGAGRVRYGSVCSGIEAASCAWEPLGWEAAWFAEIDPFCNAVLKHRYPAVENLGDFTKIGGEHGPIELLVGGTPCQDFSVAGERAGLAGGDGRLALEYVALLGRLRPRWLVWENVPGVLSSGGGRDFGAFLGALGQLGYGFAYRVLDAQHFGVAQRRRRVFVVGHLGDWRAPAAVLLERHGLSGHPPPRRPQGAGVASTLGRGPDGGFDATDYERTGAYVVGSGADGGFGEQVAHALSTRVEPFDPSAETLVLGLAENQRGEVRLTGEVGVALSTGGGRPGHGYPAVIAFDWQSGGDVRLNLSLERRTALRAEQTPAVFGFLPGQTAQAGSLGYQPEQAPTLKASSSGTNRTPAVHAPTPLYYSHDYNQDRIYDPSGVAPAVCAQDSAGARQELTGATVRRLTPVECERLQGFPDGWTDVPYRGKRAPDGRRYRALGNSMAVPCMAWIGRRIALVEELIQQRGATA